MSHISALYNVTHLEVEEFIAYKGTFTISQKQPLDFSLSFQLEIIFKHDGGRPLYTELSLKSGSSWASIIGDPTDEKKDQYDTIEWEVLKLVSKLYYGAIVPPSHAIGKKRFSRKNLLCDDWIVNAISRAFESE